MVWTVRHRQSKESVNRYANPTATAPHLYSTHQSLWPRAGIWSSNHESILDDSNLSGWSGMRLVTRTLVFEHHDCHNNHTLACW